MPADSTAFFGARNLADLGRRKLGLGSQSNLQLTPEQIYSVGWSVLEAMRRNTHTPAVLQTLLLQHRNHRQGFDDGTRQNPVLNGGGSGSVAINGQQPANGAFSSVPGGGGMQMPPPANTSTPAIAPPAGGSGGTISNPATGNAASMALAAASRPYAGSPNGQLTANQLRVMQGLATNDSQERAAQLSSQTSQNNAALQAETQMAQLDANNRQFQQRLAAAKAMGDPQNYGTPFQW